MSSFSSSEYSNMRAKAKFLYGLIDYKSFPEQQSDSPKLNLPYTEGPFISSPLLHFLKENKYYESHGSGIEDFGMTLKDFFGIPKDRFIMIETIDETTFKITYVVEPVDEIITNLLSDTDYDMRVFDKLGFTKKSKIIKLNFDVSEEVNEEPNEIISSGVLSYDDLKNSFV
jgi:hypothetical protein